MNKSTFLSNLSKKLRGLPKQEYNDAMNYYIEYFLDSEIGDDEDVTPLVGDVDEVASRIMDECAEKQIEITKKQGGVKNSSKAVWFVLLGIFAAPLAFPIVFALALTFFILITVAFAIIFSLLVSSAAIVIGGIIAIPAIFWAETSAQAMVFLGFALIGVSIGLLFCALFFKLGQLLVTGIVRLFSKFRNRKKKSSGSGTSGNINTNVVSSNAGGDK